ncbi:hypothetical protein [Nocardioides deserti]|uniref:Secreted protein n=1 Tax=Nocardioides deserti TaxID=1588644 RepID=A0ABR6U568_9ACTN|nr:hypothetical protein [Nocardioides deserti]MBC2959581.1 hypothetical protein [Nocardioides deserti]GGO73962.1 hypothetical protein GCM10012276_20830 [Nocardioides deserti]
MSYLSSRSSAVTRPRLAALAAGVVLTAALTGCGSDDESSGGSGGSSDEVVVLDQEQVDQAVLSIDNLGPGFVVDEDDDSENGDDADEEADTDLGCLDAVDDDLEESEAKAEVSYAAVNDLESPTVDSGVSSYGSVDDVTERFERLRTALADCTSIEVSEDEVSFSLTVESNEETSSDEVEEQLNITATGTASTQGVELPVAMRLSAARVDNHVVFLSRFDLGADGALEPYTEAAVGRLLAVLDGETPDDETVVVDGSGSAA